VGEISNKSYHNRYQFSSYSIHLFGIRKFFDFDFMLIGLDTDFHLHTLEFPSVILCLESPFNSTIVNETAVGALGGHVDGYESNIQMLEILSKLSYDNIQRAAEYASKIPSQMVSDDFIMNIN
jgi:hypothetical protein